MSTNDLPFPAKSLAQLMFSLQGLKKIDNRLHLSPSMTQCTCFQALKKENLPTRLMVLYILVGYALQRASLDLAS